MPVSRRHLLLGGLALTSLAACDADPGTTSSPPPTPSPTPTPTPSAPVTSPSVWPALTEPGQARKVVDELQAVAHLPVIKLDITANQATLSALDDKKARAWRWSAGTIEEVQSDIAFIQQSSFDPKDFNFDDVGHLFQTAAGISGRDTAQELQIVEQTPGSVLMVVTTRPESVPVFFRPDGSPVNQLDFLTLEGLQEGLSDAIAGRTQLSQIGLTKESIYAESPDPKDPAATLRITRQRKVPAFRTSRNEAVTMDVFSPSDIDVTVLLEQMRTLPMKWGKPADAPVTWVIDRRDGRPLPTIRFTVEGRTMVTDLTGRDITGEV